MVLFKELVVSHLQLEQLIAVIMGVDGFVAVGINPHVFELLQVIDELFVDLNLMLVKFIVEIVYELVRLPRRRVPRLRRPLVPGRLRPLLLVQALSGFDLGVPRLVLGFHLVALVAGFGREDVHHQFGAESVFVVCGLQVRQWCVH